MRDDGTWEEWVLFMLEGVEETSIQTTRLISGIKALMLEYKHKMRSKLPKIYSQDLLNLIFRHPTYLFNMYPIKQFLVHIFSIRAK